MSRRLLWQALLFVLLAANVELFCWYRLLATGCETGQGLAARHGRGGWRLARPRESAEAGEEINEEGLRNPSVSVVRAPGTVRILVLGGSVVYGLGLIEPLCVPRRLEAILREQAPPGLPLQVVNAGVPAHDSFRNLELLTDLVPRYQPDIVVALWGYNDQLYPGLSYRQQTGDRAASGLGSGLVHSSRSLLYRSATYRYLCHCLLPTPRSSAGGEPTDFSVAAGLRRLEDNLDYLQSYLEHRGIRLLVAFEPRRSYATIRRDAGAMVQDAGIFLERLTPDHTEAARAVFTEAARRRGLRFMDLDQSFRRSGMDEDVFFRRADPVHQTAVGADWVARLLAQELVRASWVPAGADRVVVQGQ